MVKNISILLFSWLSLLIHHYPQCTRGRTLPCTLRVFSPICTFSQSTSSIRPSLPLPLKNPPFSPRSLFFSEKSSLTISRIRKSNFSHSIKSRVKGCSSTARTSTPSLQNLGYSPWNPRRCSFPVSWPVLFRSVHSFLFRSPA